MRSRFFKKFHSSTKIMLCLLLAGLINLSFITTKPSLASVNDFEFSDFVGDYYLSRDEDGRSSLKIIETFTAEFPSYKQNKGIYRAIPEVYDEHSVSLSLNSVLRNGEPENIYSKTHKNNHLVIATGTDDYLLGPQKYTFEYTLRDVTKDFDKHQDFYWDTIGTDHIQPFNQVTANLHLDDSTKDALNGDYSCYQGSYGKNEKCNIEVVSPNLITFTATRAMHSNENITMAVGFKSETFIPYQKTWLEHAYPFIIAACIATPALAFIWAFISLKKRTHLAKNNRPTPVQYLPPKDISLTFSSDIINAKKHVIPAQIIDLVIKRHIKIIEETKTGFLGSKKVNYTLKLTNTDRLLYEEEKFINLLFPGKKIGDTYSLTKNNSIIASKLQTLVLGNRNRSIKSGHRRKSKSDLRPIILVVVAFLINFIVLAVSKSATTEDWQGLVIFYYLFTGLIVFTLCTPKYPLTEKGIELKNYLKGLKTYIKLAEVDRIRVLQSPKGAKKIPIDTNDKRKLVHLYEKILPYAILFGLEKQWTKQLAIYYENINEYPTWYDGNSAFNAAIFASSLNSFSRSISNNFTPPSPSNSSSSGSSGGGFSGGGGGGGGFGGR